jgi:uncharacterized protein YacL
MLTSIFFSGLYFIPVSLKAALIAAVISAVISLIILIIIEYISHTVTPRLLFVAVGGLMLGLSLGYLLNQAFSSLNIALLSGYYDIIQPLLYHIPGFALVFFSVINNEEIRILDRIFPRGGDDPDSGIAYKILDTSVIID